MVLVDTSAWIAVLRPEGPAALRAEITALMADGTAAWCPAVRLELWPGAKGRAERETLNELNRLVHDFPLSPPVWEAAIRLATRARTSGVQCPYLDTLIFACAQFHGARILHRDKHFDLLARL